MKLSNRRILAAIAALAAAAAIRPPQALALTTLKQVQISNGSQIDLLFDGKVAKGQIRTEYFNDIIQLSLTDVAVYPAKISSVTGGSLTKIFAYQYAPKLVRCRFTVKGKAEDYKDKVSLATQGKILTVRIGEGIAESSLQPAAARAVPGSAGDHSPAAKSAAAVAAEPAQAEPSKPADAIQDKEERALLDRVIQGAGPQAPAPEKKAANLGKPAESDTLVTSSSSAVKLGGGEDLPVGHRAIAGGKPLPSPMRAFGKLALVLGVFGLAALALKRLMGGAAANKPGMLGAVSRFARKGLGREGKMIEVVSSHYLGPKKSIAVVKVAGRMMVLGITNESINLITQLPAGASESALDALDLDDLGFGMDESASASKGARQGAGATAAGPAAFSDLLSAERGKPAASRGAMGPLTAAIQNYQQGRAKPAAPAPASQAPAGEPAVSAAGAYGRSPAQASLQAAMQRQGAGPSPSPSVRTQIRSRLEGLKPL